MPHHILIVEDDISNFQLMSSLVTLEGYGVQHARHGEQALEMIEQNPPCLILLDLRLPGMDGWKVAALVKGSADFHHIPIVAVSVQVDPSDVTKATQAGCDDYLAKPFNVHQLRQVIQNYSIC
jgi:CheY-like chemotaxis protein